MSFQWAKRKKKGQFCSNDARAFSGNHENTKLFVQPLEMKTTKDRVETDMLKDTLEPTMEFRKCNLSNFSYAAELNEIERKERETCETALKFLLLYLCLHCMSLHGDGYMDVKP